MKFPYFSLSFSDILLFVVSLLATGLRIMLVLSLVLLFIFVVITK